jgi:uncharacterized repeat protein (TIGR04076 family)
MPPAGYASAIIAVIRGEKRETVVADEQAETPFELARLRVTVVEIGGRSVCGLAIGDYFEVSESSRISLPAGKHFCLYAMAAVIPLLPAKMRALDANDWMAQDSLVCCPDPEERLVMKIERVGVEQLLASDLT